MGTTTMSSSSVRPLALLAALAPLVFTLGWVVGEMLQGGSYQWARHDISDLAALTARAPWVMLACQGVAGALVIAFALLALRPALALRGRRGAVGPWLVAASLMGLDNVSDVFFRLDCRAADGCNEAMRAASFGGKVHMLVGLVTALITVAAPFVLARRLRLHPDYRDLFWPAIGVGVAVAGGLVAYVALDGRWGQGIAQRAMAVVVSAAISALAVVVARRARTSAAPAPPR